MMDLGVKYAVSAQSHPEFQNADVVKAMVKGIGSDKSLKDTLEEIRSEHIETDNNHDLTVDDVKTMKNNINNSDKYIARINEYKKNIQHMIDSTLRDINNIREQNELNKVKLLQKTNTIVINTLSEIPPVVVSYILEASRYAIAFFKRFTTAQNY